MVRANVKGYIKVHRSVWDSDVLSLEQIARFVKMTSHVNSGKSSFIIEGKEFHLPPGSSYLSYSQWSDILELPKYKAVRLITLFDKVDLLDVNIVEYGKNKKLTISICDWDSIKYEKDSLSSVLREVLREVLRSNVSGDEGFRDPLLRSLLREVLRVTSKNDVLREVLRVNPSDSVECSDPVLRSLLRSDIDNKVLRVNPSDSVGYSVSTVLNKTILLRNKKNIQKKESDFSESKLSCQTSDEDLTPTSEIKNSQHEIVKNDDSHKVPEYFMEVCEVVEYLNKKLGTNRKPEAKSSKHIRGRLRDGADVDILKMVIDLKFDEWQNDNKMRKYLKVDTLFNAEKFEKYIEELEDSMMLVSRDLEIGDELVAESLKNFNDNDWLEVDWIDTSDLANEIVDYSAPIDSYPSRLWKTNTRAEVGVIRRIIDRKEKRYKFVSVVN